MGKDGPLVILFYSNKKTEKFMPFLCKDKARCTLYIILYCSTIINVSFTNQHRYHRTSYNFIVRYLQCLKRNSVYNVIIFLFSYDMQYITIACSFILSRQHIEYALCFTHTVYTMVNVSQK